MRLGLLIIVLCFSFLGIAQESDTSQQKDNRLGFKAGVNFSKFQPDDYPYEFESITGFYAGAFYQVKLDDKFYFKPELLFSIQGSGITIRDIPIPLVLASSYDFDFEVYDYAITTVLAGRWNFIDKFYLNSGLQFNFIVDQKFQSDGNLLTGTGFGLTYEDGESLEIGVNVGLGYQITDNIAFLVSGFQGFTGRNGDAKSRIYQFGIEYTL